MGELAAAGGLRRAFAKVEAAVTVFERTLIVVLLAVMAGAVFFDALHRIFAAREGRVERLLSAAFPSAAGAIQQVIAPALLALATFGIVYAALRTRQQKPVSRARTLALAALVAVGLAGATRLLVKGLPNGLVWSQQMALCFMLWVGLTGGSLATREHSHIVFELAAKLWPPAVRGLVEALARIAAAAFSFGLAFLAVVHAREHYLEWASSGGLAGLFEAFRVPRWTIFGFLPIPLAIMGVRFLAFGVRAPEVAS